ncbi:hypothetical protein [Gordonia sp. NB41Y]|uniref:hypothetical protein n=1 Tax=Gordonia sp. NB41Y TaxID=875808 RepID=UPI0002BD94DD|nr:hypothetical protein [Gordonia sp. NB41Y]EMP09839.1 hypothetical protein ISGA_4057 [Gordonia sp. NB41Y]WLP90076.1 hypothetical protein Q9K23_21535 [Gordonia sp. NB41Y]
MTDSTAAATEARFPVTSEYLEILAQDFIVGGDILTDANRAMAVYIYKFRPDGEDDPESAWFQTPRVYIGDVDGHGVDLADPVAIVRLGLAIAQAGLRAAEIARRGD